MSYEHTTPPFVARMIHRLSVAIILAWLAIAVIVSIGVPSLEQVEKEHSVSLSPQDAPSFKAAKRVGKDFKESSSGSVAMIVLEGQQPLGDDAHNYYHRLMGELKDDPKHVQRIQDFWGDPLTAAAAQSADGKAAYVQLDLAGEMGQTSANESVQAVENIVNRTPPPPGVKVYVTGPAPLTADMVKGGDRTLITITVVSIAVIFTMLLLVYRSEITARGWRRIGTSIVRWPAPILAATCALAVIGLLTLQGYNPSYNDQKYIPKDIPASLGYAAAERHFPQSRMTMPEILLVEAGLAVCSGHQIAVDGACDVCDHLFGGGV